MRAFHGACGRGGAVLKVPPTAPARPPAAVRAARGTPRGPRGARGRRARARRGQLLAAHQHAGAEQEVAGPCGGALPLRAGFVRGCGRPWYGAAGDSARRRAREPPPARPPARTPRAAAVRARGRRAGRRGGGGTVAWRGARRARATRTDARAHGAAAAHPAVGRRRVQWCRLRLHFCGRPRGAPLGRADRMPGSDGVCPPLRWQAGRTAQSTRRGKQAGFGVSVSAPETGVKRAVARDTSRAAADPEHAGSAQPRTAPPRARARAGAGPASRATGPLRATPPAPWHPRRRPA